MARILYHTVPVDWRKEQKYEFLDAKQHVGHMQWQTLKPDKKVIDQYRVTRDAHGEITSDPNRDGDEQYVVRLIGQVITVSVETQKTVNSLPAMKFE